MGFSSDLVSSLTGMVGARQKAILEIADFNETQVKMNKAQAPSATGGQYNPGTTTGESGYSSKAVKQYAQAAGVEVVGEGTNAFIAYSNFKKYRFECQFNPEELHISGFGGEEMPVQSFRPQDESERKDTGSTMSSAKTHIDLHFKLVFDQTNIQDAFYSDKFTLSGTNMAKGAATAVSKAVTGGSYSVQSQVEALTAIVRDGKKTLARFAWGDMVYEGVINTISAEYVMFNVNCEPIRAFVNVGMILYDEEVAGAHSDIWMKEYLKDIYSIKDGSIMDRMKDELGPAEAAQNIGDIPDDLGEVLGSMFSL
ncbi:MAG: hypothetical protein IJU77_06420 [Butyrivibrio sp.]|nr:hypothetical protein [Butyrivibrio sp.]